MITYSKIVILNLFILYSSIGWSQADNGGLLMSIAVDFQGEFGIQPAEGPDRFEPREAEFQFYAPIDHLFDGSASFAAHQEKGVYQAELHEATLSSSKVIPRTRFRMGKFFLGIGKLNQVHRHDWPFISAPRIHEEIFGDEAVADSGGEITTLLPLPFFLEVSSGVTNGWTFGHAHGLGTRPKVPTHYARMVTFKELGTGGFQLGGNYLGRTDYEGTKMSIFGTDFIMKINKNGHTFFLLQAEYWRRSLTTQPNVEEEAAEGSEEETPASTTEISQGFYIFPEIYLRKNIGVGFRADFYTPPKPTEEGAEAEENYMGFSPQITIKPSEFSRFRLAFHYKKKHEEHDHDAEEAGAEAETTAEEEPKKSVYDKTIELQATFILGAHPAHDF